MSAQTCSTISHGSYPALREVFVQEEHDGAWWPYCIECAVTMERAGHEVRPIYGTASFRSDDGPGYPNWTLERRDRIVRAAHDLITGRGDEDRGMRVLYDLLHEDGR